MKILAMSKVRNNSKIIIIQLLKRGAQCDADVLENKEEERINTDEIIAWVNQHQFTYAVHSRRYVTYITAFGH